MKTKKLISILLSVVMTVMSASFVMAEDTQNVYSEDIKTITALGFFKKIATTDENAAVTKGMFAAAVMDLIGVKAGNSNLQSPFSDVTTSTQYYNEICLAAQYGIINNSETPKFEPDATVTYTDAALMLVNALGYHDYAVYGGGYPDGYLKLAADIGLGDDLNVGSSAKLSAGMCARLFLNAGQANVVNVLPYKGGYKVEKGDTLFWAKHNIVKSTGIVYGNEYTSIDTSNGIGKNSVKIGDITGTIYYSNDVTEYLGYNVDFYYRSNNGDNTILCMQPKKTNITVIDSANVYAYNNQKLSYSIGSKEKSVTIGKDVNVIYNGVFTLIYNQTDGSSIFMPNNGEVKLIDNNNDGKIEVVSVLSYEDLVVSAVDKMDGIVYDKYDPAKKLDFSRAESDPNFSWIMTNNKGVVTDYSQLAVWDVISIAKSMDDKLLRAVVSRNTAMGKITSVGEEDGKHVVLIGDITYVFADEYIQYGTLPKAGQNATIYLDYCGKVAAMTFTDTSNHYGFLLKPIKDDVEETYMLRLMDDNGVVKIINCAEKVKIDGTTYTGSGLSAFLEFTSEDIARRGTFGNMNEAVNKDELDAYQVIVYRMNTEEEIYYIDTIRKSPNETDDTLHAINNINRFYKWYNSPANQFGDTGGVVTGSSANSTSRPVDSTSLSIAVTGKSLFLNTPAITEMNATKDYKISSLSDFSYGPNYNVRAYTTKANSSLPEALHICTNSATSAITENVQPSVIKSIAQGINQDDQEVTQLTYYTGSTEYTTEVLPEVDTSSYRVGDIIKVAVNAQGQISAIKLFCAVPTNNGATFGPADTSTSYWFGNGTFTQHVTRVFMLEDDILSLTRNINSSTTLLNCDFMRILKDKTAMYVVKFNGRNGKTTVEPISYDNRDMIKDYVHNGVATPVYADSHNTWLMFMVVYDISQ